MILHKFGPNSIKIQSHIKCRDKRITEARKRVSLKYKHIEFVSSKAALFQFTRRKVWLPKKLITIISDSKIVNMPDWLAIKTRLKST